MQDFTHLLLSELRDLVSDLGKDGGLISPSVYDTAQVIRFTLADEAAEPALTWLLNQQHIDGGWGEPAAPYARHVPTLAAILAIHQNNQQKEAWQSQSQQHCQCAITAGIKFLQQSAPIWRDFTLDLLPIAAEMILPSLIEQAMAAGLPLDPTCYRTLFDLRDKKCRQIHKYQPGPGDAPTYSWEAWGQTPLQPLFDRSGGVGHSPSATAAWLKQSRDVPQLAGQREQANDYLVRAAQATGVGIAGVVPNVYPITGFEQTYGLYALLLTDLFHEPLLQTGITAQVEELRQAMNCGNGMSFGDQFAPDADSTGLATAILHQAGHVQLGKELVQFKNGHHFYTFPHELNPSVFSNAHALYALTTMHRTDLATEAFLVERQEADGHWFADKWHSSWIYNTLEVTFVLQQLGYTQEVRRAVQWLVAQQNADGGWGGTGAGTGIDTSYALITLYQAAKAALLCPAGQQAVARGYEWLLAQSNQPTPAEQVWLGKELYSPYRVDRIYKLVAILATARHNHYATN